jgi:hypothetical protein
MQQWRECRVDVRVLLQRDTFTGISGLPFACATRQRLRLELDYIPKRSKLFFSSCHAAAYIFRYDCHRHDHAALFSH